MSSAQMAAILSQPQCVKPFIHSPSSHCRFHAYAVTMEMDSYENSMLNGDPSQANVIMRKRTYGGVPPGAGMREDVILLFEELEEARNTAQQLEQLLHSLPEQKGSSGEFIMDGGSINTGCNSSA